MDDVRGKKTQICIRLNQEQIKALKKASLNEKYQGKYQVLIRDIIEKFIKESESK